jgi:hypothetical protein
MDELRMIAPSAFATQAHNSRSARYVYIPTVEVIEGLMKAGFVPYFATQSRSRVEGKAEYTKHMIRFGHPDVMNGMQVGDSVPQVAMVNSHDGTSTYELDSALWRLKCSNGLMVAGQSFSSVKVYHKGNIIDDVVDGSYRVIQESEKALTTSAQWGQLQLTNGEQKAFTDAAHELRFADSEGKITSPITPEQLLQARRPDDGIRDANYRLSGVYGFAKPDLWHTLNVVQENVIKGGLHGVRNPGTRERRRVTTRQVNGIDQDVKLNKALWMLAEKMAELKTTA